MTARAATLALLLAAPFAVAPGCLLPSYDRVPATHDDVTGGKAGSSASGGTSTGGTSPGGEGGGGGSGGAPGGEGGGGANPVSVAIYKQYVVEQGVTLSISASEGLFQYTGAADRGWTNVRSSSRDTSLPRDAATLEIDPRTGAFTFTPAADLFGVYHATYVLENDLGNGLHDTGNGDLYITVQPVAVDIGVVADGIGGFVVSGASGEGVGRAVAGAGDVDGDGFDDFLVGAPAAASGKGRVYVVFGGTEHESFTLAASPGSGARYGVLNGSGTEALGTSVSGAGDLDGDGLDDFVVGAPGETGSADGRAYVIRGRARAELSGAVGDVVAAGGLTITRANDGENIGALVAGGGDLTGDDTPDIVVFGQSSGTFYVVDGLADADVELANDNAAFFGNGTIDTASWRSLDLLGDVSGDDSGDLVVGTGSVAAVVKGPASTFPAALTGAVFMPENGLLVENALPRGFVSVSAAGDFDGDRVRDSAFCHARSAAGERCRIFLGMPASASDGSAVTGFGSGDIRVAGGGETSGDAYADLLFAETDSASPSSSAWVMFGRARPVSTLDVRSLGDRGFSISGGADIESVALGGDIDGPARDGTETSDWLVGDADGSGRITVIFGGSFSR